MTHHLHNTSVFQPREGCLKRYLDHHVERLTAAGWTYTSSLHETKAGEMKDVGIDFSEAAKESRKRFDGYWIIRFQDPDAEEAKALKKIQRLG